MPFRAILFDIGDTLWHSRGAPPAEEFRRLAAERAANELRRLGIHHADPALVARSAWVAMEEAMRQARATDRVEPDYGMVSQHALAELGISLTRDQAAELLEATYVSGIEGGKAPFPDARDTLLALRARGFALGSVTNRAFGGERFRLRAPRHQHRLLCRRADGTAVEQHRETAVALGHHGVNPGDDMAWWR